MYEYLITLIYKVRSIYFYGHTCLARVGLRSLTYKSGYIYMCVSKTEREGGREGERGCEDEVYKGCKGWITERLFSSILPNMKGVHTR